MMVGAAIGDRSASVGWLPLRGRVLHPLRGPWHPQDVRRRVSPFRCLARSCSSNRWYEQSIHIHL